MNPADIDTTRLAMTNGSAIVQITRIYNYDDQMQRIYVEPVDSVDARYREEYGCLAEHLTLLGSQNLQDPAVLLAQKLLDAGGYNHLAPIAERAIGSHLREKYVRMAEYVLDNYNPKD